MACPGTIPEERYQAAWPWSPAADVHCLALANQAGAPRPCQLSAVLVPVEQVRASVMFVDNRTRTVYGQQYMERPEHADSANRLTADVMAAIRSVYEKEVETARSQGQEPSNG